MKKPKNDIEAVEVLANEKYNDWISAIREILQKPENPISLKNGTWTVKKREEIWQSLGTYLFDEHLDRFKNVVVNVLKEPDPQFELPPEERYAANIHGKVLKHSHSLRKGLAETLALLGAQPDALKNCSRGKAEAIAICSIREIFRNSDWILWASLNTLLPTLAEAAPEEFLDAVENALSKKPCPFDVIFSQENTGIFGNNYMTGLLWALETLSWDEKYLVQVTVILGKLASRDPGGNWGNRPDNSLMTIFLPWLPQTIASVDKRKVAIQTLREETPEIAWKLLLSLLPSGHQTSMGCRKPVWRKIIPDDWEKGVTNKEYWEQISSYAEIAVEMAKGNFAKLGELIKNLDNLPEPFFNKFLAYLGSAEIVNLPEEDRTSLWVVLTDFISKHKRYAGADWALRPELVGKIEQVAKSITPLKPENLYSRLFVEGDFELYENNDWRKQEIKLEENRQNAIREIIAKGKLEAVIRFAEVVDSPQKVGFSLGFIAEDDTDSVILPKLIEDKNKKLEIFASGFIWGRYRNKGWGWVDHIDTSGWSKEQIGKFLSCLPFTQKTWEYSEKFLGEHEIEYWSRVGINPYQDEGNLDIAIDKLIKHERPNAAIFCLNRILHDKKPLDKTKAINALLNAVSSKETDSQMDRYYTTEIIKALQNDPDTDREDLFRIEFAYLPLLTGPGRSASPKLLEQRLATDADFFCESIRLLYRSKKKTKADKKTSKQQKIVAVNVWRLLNDWATLPGMHPDGSFSVNDFNAWLNTVKIKCEQSGHLDVAMLTIGSVLIHYIPDPSGLWIHKSLAEALNADNADDMRRGFRTGIFNSRGVHCVDPTGNPEKELAAKYRQQADEVENAKYYRLAITLRNLADSYENEAKRTIEEHKDGRI